MCDAAPVPFGWARAAGLGLTFRRITETDLPFLARVYASTRAEELAVVTTMTDAQKAAFLAAQFQVAACALPEILSGRQTGW